MPLKIKTPTGFSDVTDFKVRTPDGKLVDVEKLVVKTSKGTFETVYQRVNPLRMFVETDPNSPDYVSLDDVRSEYPEYDNFWNWINVGTPEIPIPTPLGAEELPSHKFYDLHKLGYAGTPGNEHEEVIATFNTVQDGTNSPENLYWARIFKLVMDRRHKNLCLPIMNNYSGAMLYLSELGIQDPIQRNEIFMTYHTKIVHANPSGPVFDTGGIQYMLQFLEGFKGFPANLIYWVSLDDEIKGYFIASQVYHFPYLTNSTGLVYVQPPISPENNDPNYDELISLQFEQIAFPFRWKNPNGTFTRWTEESSNPDVDPFTEEYGLLLNDEQREAYKVLYLMFHEIGHAIDMYHTMYSAETELGDNTVMIDRGNGLTGVPFSCSPAWTRPSGASGWKMKSSKFGAIWSTLLEGDTGLELDVFYPATGAATFVPEGYDPPVSQRGTADPWEDFAECFALYMLNRNYFREVFPVKFSALETYLSAIEDFRREVLSE